MSWNYCPRVRFTPELWAKWLARNAMTEGRLELRAGIREFRSLLAAREARDYPQSFPRKRA